MIRMVAQWLGRWLTAPITYLLLSGLLTCGFAMANQLTAPADPPQTKHTGTVQSITPGPKTGWTVHAISDDRQPVSLPLTSLQNARPTITFWRLTVNGHVQASRFQAAPSLTHRWCYLLLVSSSMSIILSLGGAVLLLRWGPKPAPAPRRPLGIEL